MLKEQLKVIGGELYKPGVYELDNKDYHASAGISRSALMEFSITPKKFKHRYIDKKKKAETKAMKFGTAVHTFLLEPEKFWNCYIREEKFNKTKLGNAQEVDYLIRKENKRVISDDFLATIEGIAKSIDSDSEALELLKGGLNEKSFYWFDGDSSLLCKARPDIWHASMLVDLKTAKKADSRSFSYSMLEGGYHLQAAMCLDAIHIIAQEEHKRYFFLIVEKEEPYDIAIKKLSAQDYWQGHHDYKSKLLQLSNCIHENKWPSFPYEETSLPRHAITT
jgi:exodeoxyribonuclease VIII